MEKAKIIEQVKKESKKQATDKVIMTKEEQELNKAAFEAAMMPIDFKDEDVVLGPQEIDIRKLSDANFKQMLFRLMCVQTSQTRQLTQIVIDLERLLMLVLGQMGIPAANIGKAINELIEKLTEESKKFNLKKEQKDKIKA